MVNPLPNSECGNTFSLNVTRIERAELELAKYAAAVKQVFYKTQKSFRRVAQLKTFFDRNFGEGATCAARKKAR